MSGIAGVQTIDGSPPPAGVLSALTQALAHRGPDGTGRYVSGGIGLVRTRLAVRDLETGDQPLFDADGLVLVTNGEIYNDIELRAEIGREHFSTQADAEPILPLYRRHGLDFARALRGMYAVALYDPDDGSLVLARDPFGIKPLYYAEVEQGLVFASEPRAIFASGLVTPRLRRDKAAELLQLQFTTGRETAFEGVNRVLPGETISVAQGRVVDRRRIDALPPGAPETCNEERALAEAEDALVDAVRTHQRSDVPVGMFWNGSLGAASLLACMTRMTDAPIRIYAPAYPHGQAGDGARAAAALCGAELVKVPVREQDLWDQLPAIAAAMDDPAIDYSAIPFFAVAAQAASDVKVLLTGDGADEIFAGRGRYRSVLRPMWMGGRAMRARGALDGLGLMRDEWPHWRDGIIAAWNRAETGHTRLQCAQAVDCADWLPHDILQGLDRCLMSHSVEGRAPMLDGPLAGFAYCLPDSLKIRKGRGAWVLRHWLEDHAPQLAAQTREDNLRVLLGEWMANCGEKLAPLVAAQPGVAEMCKPERVRALFASLTGTPAKHDGQAAWVLLFFALWHQTHVAGVKPEGDALDVLAAA